jgi:predicted nucleic acid binding AN1-type Zn finger protein
MSVSLHIFFMTLHQPNRHNELRPRRPFVIALCLLKKVKKCRSSRALQYGGQSTHWTDISSVTKSRTADRFVSVSDMIDWTELENDG